MRVLLALGLVLLASVGLFRLLKWAIRRRLGGYRRAHSTVDPTRPVRLEGSRSVLVLGGGVAGLTAAVTLARRGYQVTLVEANEYLGGKLGSWQVELAPGRVEWVSHGFHAFFPHYYNLNAFLDSLELRRDFTSIGDYAIHSHDGTTLRFEGLQTTPVFNLFSLLGAGAFNLADALRAPGRDMYGIFLEYDAELTFARYDHLSFREFDRLAQVPARLKVAFNTFARAFFAEDDKLSFAELVKSFHFYYLSHDGGLIYDYPTRDYEAAFLRPIRDELERHGARLRLGQPVAGFEKTERGFELGTEVYDTLVLATDVVGARAIMTAARGIPAVLQRQFEELKAGQRYAVLRIWIDKDLREGLPVFVITEGLRVLDSVTAYHRFEQETQRSSLRRGEFVLELHCYAVPEELSGEEVRSALLAELVAFFPELVGLTVKHEVYQLKRDFTAFHVGLQAQRPTVETGVPGLVCAGDWVKLPFPAMLLECACASGLVAANHILAADGLRETEVLSVPLRGLMAGIAEPPARRRLQRRSHST